MTNAEMMVLRDACISQMGPLYRTGIFEAFGAATNLRQENERLQGQVYIPGYLKCGKCAFGGMFSILNAGNGDISAADVAGRHVCPNDGSDLERVTWYERTRDWIGICDSKDETIRLQLEAAERTGAALADHVDQISVLQADLSAHALALKVARETIHVADSTLQSCEALLNGELGSEWGETSQADYNLLQQGLNVCRAFLSTPLPVYAAAQGIWEAQARNLVTAAVEALRNHDGGHATQEWCMECQARNTLSAFLAQPASAFVERATALEAVAHEAANLAAHETGTARDRANTAEGRTVTALIHALKDLNKRAEG